MVIKAKRAPSKTLARTRQVAKQTKKAAKSQAADVEAKHRKSGGYGKSMVSIWAKPKGGIEKSPAYRKMLARCGGKYVAPAKRAGAPVKGGFPLAKYPVNVLVDNQRSHWLPDDWAQALKNTGPGGVYLGWMSPDGKFFYHRSGYPSAIEETMGRPLTAFDGLNGIIRSEQQVVNPAADRKFLQRCLTTKERKHVLAPGNFHFAVVSAFRADIDSGQHDLMHVEAQFRIAGVRPTWYVDAGSLAGYKALGLKAVVGGKLTPARNMALDVAKKNKQICVQVSDDIAKWCLYDVAKQSFRGETNFDKQNAALAGTTIHQISPVAAAQWILAKMRSSPAKPKLGGVFPTANATMTIGSDEFSTQHFILGDFFVAEPSSPCRFDNTMTLKEDYDYTCSHISKHGSVLRCNRMIVHARHSTNEGGAVAARDSAGTKERQNIEILMKKWPGAFRLNIKRANEIVLRWPKANCEETAPNEENVTGKKVLKNKLKKLAPKTQALRKAFPHTAKLICVSTGSVAEYIAKRCMDIHNHTVGQALGMKYKVASGTVRRYGYSDLRYDVSAGRLRIAK